jgi:LacI family transcriptional regulator
MKKQRRRSRNLVTLHDVARRAGVSPMTVSRYVDRSRSVRDAARVKAAIEELGYLPNESARSLASAGGIKVGLLYGNPSATYNNEFLIDLLENSRRIGAQLVIEKCMASRSAKASVRKLIAEGVDGVALPTPFCDSPALMAQFEQANIVTVAVGTGREHVRGLSLRIDNFGAAEEMTRYLISLGHRDIGFIRGHSKLIDSAQRYEGFIAALALAGLRPRADRVRQGKYTFQSGFYAAAGLLKGRGRPTAIFASNDDMAAGSLAAAHRLKLEVPKELSIVGFDDTPLASTIWPQLTTIRQPVDKLTRRALELLADEIRRRRAGKPAVSRQELVRLTLVKRDSAAPV